MKLVTCSTCGKTYLKWICGMSGDRPMDARVFGKDDQGNQHCEDCCSMRDREAMIKYGRATLYLNISDYGNRGALGTRYISATITNWLGNLRFYTNLVRIGRHNIAGVRYDVWFNGPDGATWHGTQYGDNTQICHCRRTKGNK